MTDPQWQTLLRVMAGETIAPLPTGLVIDSPWLPGWAGISILDYFEDQQAWFDANLRVCRHFERMTFLPGFWSEWGMCTEPSAFGTKCVWFENNFPSVERSLEDYAQIARLKKPNCRTDGLAPFVLKRLARCRGAMEAAGHRIRFAVARGPLNIASYLLGHTEFLLGVKTNPEEIHRLLAVITEYLVDWIGLQVDTFDTIDGIFLLDDLLGFLREDDFLAFGLPYMTQAFAARPVSVKFLHNDAFGLITAKHLGAMGVNLFNYSFKHSIAEIRKLAGARVALVGGVPPLDVLTRGTPDDVRQSVCQILGPLEDRRRILFSAGGGTPPGVPEENLFALIEAAGAF